MIVLLALALLVGIYNFVDFGTSSAASTVPASSTQVTQPTKKPSAPQLSDSTLDPRLRLDILAVSQNKRYETGGRNIFRMEELKIPAVDASVRKGPMGPEPPPTPTPTPPPPPIPLKFYGFASKSNEPKRIFLADEGEVFVARQGDIVERKYKIVQINNTSVIIEDVLNSNRQTIQLTAK
jgi:subtilisin family serine protease